MLPSIRWSRLGLLVTSCGVSSIRIDGWLRSLARLNDPADFQAVSSGCRAVLESSIDVVLVRDRPANHEKVRAWEDSAMFKQANALADYCKTRPDDAQEHHWPIQYAVRERVRVEALRRKHGWVHPHRGTPQHPDRWTGPGRDLLADARVADKLQSEFRFERFYQVRYRELCWMTHGSGLVGVRRLSAEYVPFMGARAYRECGFMAMLSARLVLEYFGRFDDGMKSAFETATTTARLVEHKAMADKGFATQFEDYASVGQPTVAP